MLNLLVKYRIIAATTTMEAEGIFSGNIISTFWDDSNNKFVVYQYSNEADTTPTTRTSGPGFGFREGTGWEALTPTNPIPYSFCSGDDLQSFVIKTSAYPYVTKISTANHFQCVTGTVCDLDIQTSSIIVMPVTDVISPDGSIQVSATSSNGVIKYSLKAAFDYATEGQTHGRFTNLNVGTYIITAKDESGCTDQVTIKVPLTTEYGVKYRLDYNDLNGNPTRIDLLERGFSGSITEVIGNDQPFKIIGSADGSLDKMFPIIPSSAELTLLSTSNFQFIDLFSQDERKYLLKYYKDWGNVSDGFVPGQQPITLPVLSQWRTEKVSSLWEDWNETTLPYVIFEADSTITRTELLYVDYKFTSGGVYTLTLNYACVTSIPLTINISVFERSKPRFSSRGSASGSGSGSVVLTFTADDTCDRIGISVNKKLASYVEFEIISVTGTVENEEAAPAPIGLELKWSGYLISSNYSEPYLKEPYPVKLVATDGLADLKTYDFSDADENILRGDIKTLDAIKLILSKTDLGINIVSAINKYEVDMLITEHDDPLNQCKFEAETFLEKGTPNNCYEVLSSILRSFGARILQRDGKWFMYCIEQSVQAMAYREFTKDGAYVGNGEVDDRCSIKPPDQSDRACFVHVSQNMETIPAYGRFYLEHKLLKNASLIKGHSFEDHDLIPNQNAFRHWTFNMSNSPGASIGIKEVPEFDGEMCFYLKYDDEGEMSDRLGKGAVTLTTKTFQVEHDTGDILELSFSLAAITRFASGNPWTKLNWTLYIGGYYYNENLAEWTTDSTKADNDLIVDKYNEPINKKLTIEMRGVDELVTENAYFKIKFTNIYTYDASSLTALKGIVSDDLVDGTRRKALDVDKIRFYKLRKGTDVESSPDILRPNDFHDTNNDVVWELEDTRFGSVRDGRVWKTRVPNGIRYFYFDNVILLHYPKGETPPEDITVERVNTRSIKIDFEESYLLNDIDTENINNSERTYKNYYKKLDGTPTVEWERTYRPGAGKLLDLLSDEVLSQYKSPSRKLTGSFGFDTDIRMSSVMSESTQGLKKFIFMSYELEDRACIINFDMAEIKNTVDSDGDDISADFNTDFSLDFHS